MKIAQPHVCVERTGVAVVQFLVGYLVFNDETYPIY
jgi:hypothetical protein